MRYFYEFILLLIFTLLWPFLTFGNVDTAVTPPGIIESMNKLLLVHKSKFKIMTNQYSTETPATIDKTVEFTISPDFMTSILLYSSINYVSLLKINSDECYFYSLMENGLLKSAEGIISHILVNFPDKKSNKITTSLIPLKNLLENVYQSKCFSNKQISSLFSSKQIIETFKTLEFKTPKDNIECQAVIKSWINNRYLPYVCKIHNSISEYNRSLARNDKERIKSLQSLNSYYEKNISSYNRQYLSNLCTNILDNNLFCPKYVSSNFWSKILRKEVPQSLLSSRCKALLKKQTLEEKDSKDCVNKLQRNPELCLSLASKEYSSLYPKSSCIALEKSLEQSKIVPEQYDCPGLVDNESVINASRIIMNFKSVPTANSQGSCSFNLLNTFASTIIESKITSWPLEICYIDIISKEEVCMNFIPGEHQVDQLSENNVVAKALYKIHGFSLNDKCTIVDEKLYNPAMLKYKNGCFIVINADECTSFNCKRKIFLNNKLISGVTFKNELMLAYYPNSFMTEGQSISDILIESLSLKTQTIFNLTILDIFFKQHKDGIIHGVGCLEDLLPQFFQTKSFNNCKPVPFIIENTIIKEGRKSLIVRLPLDNIQDPRQIEWDRVYSAVTSYKNIHPLNSWILLLKW